MRTRQLDYRSSGQRKSERGAALLLVLGILTALLLLGIGFSYTTVMDRQGASASADLLRSRLLAESGVERALASLKRGLAGEVDPSTQFYAPPAGSPWAGRSYLASINGTDTAGIQDALASEIDGLSFTPNATLHDHVGWIPMRGKRNVGGKQKDVLIGRLAYVVIDESGKLDPGALVSAGDEGEDETPDTGEAHERTGASAQDISLADAGLKNADLFRPQAVEGGQAGKLPVGSTWHSVAHMLRATGAGQDELNEMVRVLHPFSRDDEVFWRDANDNGVCDAGETEPRVDVTAPLNLQQLYDLFLGENKGSGRDDCDWLKGLDDSEWVQNWAKTGGMSTVQVRQRIAAQTAVNMLDYADPDSQSTLAYVDSNGQIHSGSAAGQYNVKGVEKGWGLSSVAMKVEVKTSLHDVRGLLNINPGNSAANQFEMTTPGGTISRETLHNKKVSYSYEGIASEIMVKPKAQGRTLIIDGEAVVLKTNIRYTITADSMSVKLYNDFKNKNKTWATALGKWWLEIVDAVNVKIDPDPRAGMRFRAGFKGQAFYPYASAHDNEVNFAVVNGKVVVKEAVVPEVKVLGAALTHAGQYTVPVTVSATAGGVSDDAWGDCKNPVNSNVNDGQNPRYATLNSVPAGGSISLQASSWLKKSLELSGADPADWQEALTVLSTDSKNVAVLRSGDKVPAAFKLAGEVPAFLESYISEGAAILNSNQVLVLFELGTSDDLSPEMDYQDAAILITLKKSSVGSVAPVQPVIAIDYVVSLQTDSGKSTATGTVRVSPAVAAVVDGGHLVYSSDYEVAPEWTTVAAKPGDSYRIVNAEIAGVRLLDGSTTLSQAPLDATTSLCTWSQEKSAKGAGNYYASLTAYDPMQDHRAESESGFDMFWSVLPDKDYLSVGDGSLAQELGSVTVGYNSSPYSGVTVGNESFRRIGDIGRVHSYRPMQSLRLWSASSGEEAGHDGALLDLFKSGFVSRKSGKVMANTRLEDVLMALFAGATTVDADSAVKAVLAKRDDGVSFNNIGELFGGVAGISGSDPALDAREEAAVGRLAELVTTRQNYFTIIIVAQALKDIEGFKYDSDGDGQRDTVAELNSFDVMRDAKGNVVKYLDSIRAEQKVMVVVYRDAITNQFTVEHFEYLQ